MLPPFFTQALQPAPPQVLPSRTSPFDPDGAERAIPCRCNGRSRRSLTFARNRAKVRCGAQRPCSADGRFTPFQQPGLSVRQRACTQCCLKRLTGVLFSSKPLCDVVVIHIIMVGDAVVNSNVEAVCMFGRKQQEGSGQTGPFLSLSASSPCHCEPQAKNPRRESVRT